MIHAEIGSDFVVVRLRKVKTNTLEKTKGVHASLWVEGDAVLVSIKDRPGDEHGSCLAEVELPLDVIRAALAVVEVSRGQEDRRADD